MKKFIRALPLMLLTGCAGLKPFGGENSVKLELPGTADFSAAVILDRLPDGLRVTVEVKDGSLVTDSTKELWDGDCVEFYADLRPYRERVLLNQYGPGVFQITVRPPAGGVPADWSFRSTGLPVPEGFTAKAVQTKGGYTVQIFLPEESTREIHGPIRDTLYVDVAVNNVNAGGSRTKIFWKGNRDNWQHPHNFQPVSLPVIAPK
jgi:hypothetical protein